MKLGNLVPKAMELWKTMMSWRRSNNHATEQMARHRHGKVEISKVEKSPTFKVMFHDFFYNEWFMGKKHHPHLFFKKTQVCPKLKAPICLNTTISSSSWAITACLISNLGGAFSIQCYPQLNGILLTYGMK